MTIYEHVTISHDLVQCTQTTNCTTYNAPWTLFSTCNISTPH